MNWSWKISMASKLVSVDQQSPMLCMPTIYSCSQRILERRCMPGQNLGQIQQMVRTIYQHEKIWSIFSKHTQSQTKRSDKNTLQVKCLKKDAVYLGAPMFLSRAPSKDFSFLQDKLEAKLMGWRSKCLSWAGRKTLINSMAQPIPIYTLSTFGIPNKVCDRLDSLTRRFWWKPNQSDGRYIA